MKVLLVRPKAPNLFRFSNLVENEPIELEYLQTALNKEGHESWIYDSVFEAITFETTLERTMPDLVAITGYITQENIMRDYAQVVKKYNSSTFTVVGGVHVQLNAHRFYTPYIDFIYRSESVDGFAALVNCLANGSEDFRSINGLIYRKSEEWVINPLVPTDIDLLPIPDRSYFYTNAKRYRYLELTNVATLKTAFSCPHNCNFCYCTQLGCGIHKMRNLPVVMEELKDLKADNVQIVDDDFLADIDRAWSLYI
jgi:hopanoid C-3 methylase